MNVSHYPQTTLSTFENALIRLLDPFPIVRFMNWQQINRLTWDTRPIIQEWDELPTVDEDWEYRGGPWGAFRGVPLAVIVRIANVLNTRPWIHVPVQASNDLIERMVSFVIEGSNQRPIIEFSNEVWNNTFNQFKFAVKGGNAKKLANNDFQAALRWQATRTRKISEVAQGSADVVIAAQFFNAWVAEEHIKNVGEYVTGLAVAPYLGRNQRALRMSGGEPTARHLLDIHNEVIAEIYEDVAPRVAKYREMCDSAGLQLLAYEGGLHQVARNDNEKPAFELEKRTFLNYNRSIYAGVATEMLWRVWRENGGEEFCPYSLSTVFENPWNGDIQNQYFGHTEILGKELRMLPKYNGSVRAL